MYLNDKWLYENIVQLKRNHGMYSATEILYLS